jgi:hypothetical protein
MNININMNENTYNIKKNKLIRPFSAHNIRRDLSENTKTEKNFEIFQKNENNKFFIGEDKNLDLDLLFEKQLKKLREINKEEESNKEMPLSFNNDLSNNDNKNDYLIKKKNEESNNNEIKKNYVRPISQYLKHNNEYKNLPKINSFHKSNKILKIEDAYINHLKQKNEANNMTGLKSPKNILLHKDFGKVPKYLQEMKIRAEMMKEIEKKKKEEENYPKGTRLLSEEERNFTLEKLKKSKKDLENLLEKLPISLESLSLKLKQKKICQELDEIDKDIMTFSRKQVFVRVDS